MLDTQAFRLLLKYAIHKAMTNIIQKHKAFDKPAATVQNTIRIAKMNSTNADVVFVRVLFAGTSKTAQKESWATVGVYDNDGTLIELHAKEAHLQSILVNMQVRFVVSIRLTYHPCSQEKYIN